MKRIAALTVTAVLLLGIAAGWLLVSGCGGVPADAVATVGDASVAKTQFEQLMSQSKTQAESQGMTFPAEGSATYRQYSASIVAYLVQSEVIAQGASSLGVTVTDKEIDAQVTQLKQSYGGEKKVLALLKQQGMTMTLLKQSLKNRSLSQKVAAAVVKTVNVDDGQVREYWKAHAGQYRKKAKTATYAKAKAKIRTKLLSQARQKAWEAWLVQKTEERGVRYAAGYDPAELTASPSPSAPASTGG